MILYVNGDSHAAAAEAVNNHAFAIDDPAYFYLGRRPHPDNQAVAWTTQLARALKVSPYLDAESAASNDRIMRTTRTWLAERANSVENKLVIIQWSTWEREEWLYGDTYYQVGSSGIDQVPPEAAERYRNFVIRTDWETKTKKAHTDIWKFHQELKKQKVPHVFFNGNNDFSSITKQKDWGTSYIGPYDPTQTYDAVIRSKGIDTVAPNSWHFGQDGHAVWFRYMLNYLMTNKFI
jgi:hypothetical protein